MNKKYMDFVPKNGSDATRQTRTRVIMPVPTSVDATNVSNLKAKKTPRLTGSDVLGRGLIDAAAKRPIKTPLRKGAKVENSRSDEKLNLDREMRKATAKAEALNAEKMKLPQAHFVNTEKVAKRPLSKNVYQKKIVVPKEEPQAPVTIIHKPEKDSKVGLIVTIIITIILGAAAGTVAFLLIPK